MFQLTIQLKTILSMLAVLSLILIIGCSDKPPKELYEPNDEALTAPSPEIYKINFQTNEGNIIVEVHRDWSPNGADRLYHLVNYHFYDGIRFFRVVKGFMAQFGYHGDPKIGNVWRVKNFPDDSVVESNLRGYVSFAKSSMPNSRSTNLFINYKNNSFLDNSGFSPFGKVIEGMDVVDKLYGGYGDAPPTGSGPSQQKIQEEGNTYLTKNFPELDYIKKARIVE